MPKATELWYNAATYASVRKQLMYTVGNSLSNSWDRQTAIASCKEYGPRVVVSKREGERRKRERRGEATRGRA